MTKESRNMDVNRRNFLRGAAVGAAGTAITGAALVKGAEVDANAAAVAVPPSRYPFHGVHQSGILVPPPAEKQNFACHVAFDVISKDKDAVVAAFKTLTARARFLCDGGSPADLGIGEPPADSAVLGPVVESDGLTVTVAVGSSLFDRRFGLADRKPAKLKPMTVFPNDFPEAAWSHGDLLVQLCAHNPDTVHHALRDITRAVRGDLQMRWRIEGYNSPPRPSGTGRNLLGFKDGTANPVSDDAEKLVWTGDGEPAWTAGGTYMVVRLIRMMVEFWDRVSINEQERMFGRRRDSGAPLDGNNEFDTPNYAADADGKTIPLDAHIRLANPRTGDTDNQRLVRRSYNYDLGVDANGNMQSGHVFVCYQQDLERQFETVQNRLNDEPLIDYVQPFGGGYFFALPGIADEKDWYGRALLG
ncbi:deferrochelatase/peroxidase EfeB [Mycobacteroides abscessus]|nr:deferrochelatase/peroxidase EfeB [Mycobacteroides abscessus]PVA93497.1 deferrochelatase/peroxidase EfeB [Mycobacteroides abscessus]PVB17732.1 deferrochelatase/peroxidase EfeB [Mycobacteroides abscessus]PVB56296.1 deferrochelatase/peroxidase EfeB [Mycobacteroides abscessus]RIR75209.1 deferrochelatase/peroxidase EfeB [Mycobacteroides abscessus]